MDDEPVPVLRDDVDQLMDGQPFIMGPALREGEGAELFLRTLQIQQAQGLAPERAVRIARLELLREQQARAEGRAHGAAGEHSSDAGAKKLLTVAEVATELNLPRNRVYELTASGELPSIHIGTSVRIPRAALDAFIARGGTRPGDD